MDQNLHSLHVRFDIYQCLLQHFVAHQSIGLRSGVLRPASPVLISPRLRELLLELEVKRLNI